MLQIHGPQQTPEKSRPLGASQTPKLLSSCTNFCCTTLVVQKGLGSQYGSITSLREVRYNALGIQWKVSVSIWPPCHHGKINDINGTFPVGWLILLYVYIHVHTHATSIQYWLMMMVMDGSVWIGFDCTGLWDLNPGVTSNYYLPWGNLVCLAVGATTRWKGIRLYGLYIWIRLYKWNSSQDYTEYMDVIMYRLQIG